MDGLDARLYETVRVSLRINPTVLAAFQKSGAGWQTRMNRALREGAQDHDLLAADAS
ncbi:BrnA antitoxin family protein [Massilia sp. DWR3-1-1]|uniref:BrnA antitoxin family protein n=1 Tax=Massilia sp. DWR3-1-1 TaxID=2804559 RepID=UPI003CF03F8D